MSFDNGIWGPYSFIQDLRKEWLNRPNPKYNPTKSQKIKNKRRNKWRGKKR